MLVKQTVVLHPVFAVLRASVVPDPLTDADFVHKDHTISSKKCVPPANPQELSQLLPVFVPIE